MKLNLGCGMDYKKKYINLDSNKKIRADIYHDINKFPWPFKDDAFDEIYTSHILEHVNDLIKTMAEIKRVCKNNARVIIKVPFFPSIYAVNDPTHKRFFTYFTFEYFTNKSFYDLPKFEIIERRIHFTWKKGFGWIDKIINLFPVFYSRFLSFIFPSNELYVELRIKKSK